MIFLLSKATTPTAKDGRRIIVDSLFIEADSETQAREMAKARSPHWEDAIITGLRGPGIIYQTTIESFHEVPRHDR